MENLADYGRDAIQIKAKTLSLSKFIKATFNRKMDFANVPRMSKLIKKIYISHYSNVDQWI